MSVTHPPERRRLLPLSSATNPSPSASRQGEWGWSVLLAGLDVLAWSLSFGAILQLRAGRFQLDLDPRLVVLGLWPLAAIVLTLFIVGGYDRRTDWLSLTYMSEHLIGMGAALVAASVCWFTALRSYEFPVKPGRGTLLLGFAAFTPLSLILSAGPSAPGCARTRPGNISWCSARRRRRKLFFDTYKRIGEPADPALHRH